MHNLASSPAIALLRGIICHSAYSVNGPERGWKLLSAFKDLHILRRLGSICQRGRKLNMCCFLTCSCAEIIKPANAHAT